MHNQRYLTCKGVIFYCPKDEDAFFEWIKRIDCIEKFEGAGDELYLYIASNKLHDHDLRDIIGLFHRYKIEMKQLARFLTDDNRKWFYENKRAFWRKKVFDIK